MWSIYFMIIINKSQGQLLEVCRINLEFPGFAQGQLYVASSRVGKATSLYIYLRTAKQNENIVYQKAIH